MKKLTGLFIAIAVCLGALSFRLHSEIECLKADSARITGDLTSANEKLAQFDLERNQREGELTAANDKLAKFELERRQLDDYFRKRIEEADKLLKEPN